MKRGILVATLIVTAGGVASANLLTTAPQAQAVAETMRPASTAGLERTATAPAPTAPLAAAIAAPIATKGAPAPTVQKASVEARQPPVPFQLKPRPPVNLPPAADKATEAKASGKPGETPADPATGDTSGEKAARAAIEADGYKGVTILRKGVNGVWHAKALRGKTEVMVTVDATGSVSAN